MRQISTLYYRERDNRGIPLPIKQSLDYDDEGSFIDTTKDDFYNLGRALGLSEEELDRRWLENQENG